MQARVSSDSQKVLPAPNNEQDKSQNFDNEAKMGAEKIPPFRIVQKFKTDYSAAEFIKYESTRTGLQVVTINRKGPKVKGWFALGTEIFDPSGARMIIYAYELQ
jgi:hypothetical protein